MKNLLQRAMVVGGSSGDVYAVGDADYEFTIMSVSKPFVFASMRLRAKPMRGEEKQ